MDNPFDLSQTGSGQKNNSAGLFSGSASGQPAMITPSSGSTVSGQLNGLLQQDSPYLKEARARAQRQANSRGLINSSIAAGAGETAAIQAALPIAQQDANTFFTAQRSNQDATNQFGLQKNQFDFQGTQAGLDRTQQKDILTQQQNFQGTQAGLDRQQALTLQGNQYAFQGSQAGLDRQQQKDILGQQQNFQATQAGLDRTQQKDILSQQQTFQGTQAGLDRAQQAGLVAQELKATADRQTQQLASTERLATADNNLRLALADKTINAEQTMATLNAALQRESQAFAAQLNDEASLLQITRGRNASLQQYQVQMGNNFLTAANAIMSSPDLTVQQKEATVARMKQEFNAMLELAESLQGDAVVAQGQGGL